ncbi:MAG: response regulator [Phaeospirillum sp.]|nr:response regulator [Phaeospirillum sp.]
MQPSRTRILTRLTASFSAVLLLTILMGAMAIRATGTMSDLAMDLYTHPFAVTNALMQVRSNVNAMRADMLTMIHTPSLAEAGRMVAQVAAADAEVHRNMDIIRAQYLGDPNAVERLSRSLSQWKSTREHNVFLIRAGRHDEAIAISRQSGAEQYAALRLDLEEIYGFAIRKAAEFSGHVEAQRGSAIRHITLTLAGMTILGLTLSYLITRSIVGPLDQLRACMGRLSAGELSITVPNRDGRSEMAEMARAVEVFKVAAQNLENQRWIKDGIAQLSVAVQACQTVPAFATAALATLAPLVGAGVGLLHARREGFDRFEAMGNWGGSDAVRPFLPGEGVAGQCAASDTMIVLDHLPDDYIHIGSGLGHAAPRVALAAPMAVRGRVVAVIELASFTTFSDAHLVLIEEALPVLALNLEILERNLRTQDLLAQTQAQAEELHVSEEELRSQSEALQGANEELRASEEELRMQQEALQAANEELRLNGNALEAARAEADRRAVELDQAGRYKSEFLANMSHELRTPLNSLLILSRNLADNEPGNLTPDQVESATVVHESGAHLLALINDILDLSKVEAGKMRVAAAAILMDSVTAALRRRFLPIAADKGLSLTIELAGDLPAEICGDRGKLDQIINNLVGNALKFTLGGGVTVRLAHPTANDMATAELKDDPRSFLSLSVTDTGIGIADTDRQRIFRAFEQVDGASNRQFGGTGLGLTISRQLARLMGGDVLMTSTPGKGSTFTLLVPLVQAGAAPQDQTAPTAVPPPPAPATPPISDRHRLLLVDGDRLDAQTVTSTLGDLDLDLVHCSSGQVALDLLRSQPFDCVILDPQLSDMGGVDLLEQAADQHPNLPALIVYSAKELSQDQTLRLGEFADSIIIRGPRSAERLLDEVTLFLHSVETRLGKKAAPVSAASESKPLHLAGRTILVVDDDMRNAFALSKVLRGKGLKVLIAQDGAKALRQLDGQDHIDLVLMDMMMPGIDGYQTMAEIRKLPRFAKLPIIALTAKAMSGDRDKCIEAGADDYMAKPVDVDGLLAMMAPYLSEVANAR